MSSATPARLTQNLLLAAGSMLMALLLLGLLELALRVVGLGAPDASGASRLKYQRVSTPVLEPGRRADGTAILATSDVRLPYQTVLAEKPEGALRIFTFGGSATAGLGYSPNATFSRHLERLLERAHPERRVEVVNLGIVALASKQVKALVEDVCRSHEPDAIVVYSGNNEFLEIHAEKFAEAQATPLSRLADTTLRRTNLYRLASRAVRSPPRDPSAAKDVSNEDLRLSQHAIIQHVDMSAEEIAAVLDRYEENLEAIAEVAAATDTPLVLMTVASNWRYRGREDLPDDWLDEVLGAPGPVTPERTRAAIEVLEQTIASGSPLERWEALYRRAVAEEALGDVAAARATYRRAMNEDPHLRRALDAMADRVRALGKRRGVPVFDTIAFLEGEAERGIVGFDEFYDYVHFTPRGALLVGTELFRVLERAGITPGSAEAVADAYLRERLARLAALEADALDRGEWLGVGFDAAALADRDLWKYERLASELDQRIEAGPDVRALVYRGNAKSFELRGAEGAEADYRAALALDPGNAAIRRNLGSLLAERPAN